MHILVWGGKQVTLCTGIGLTEEQEKGRREQNAILRLDGYMNIKIGSTI